MNIFPDEKKPLLFAHRGYSALAPENTLAAFQEGLNNKIPGVELDIHLCRSGELAVTHDDNLKRVTGLERIVEEMDYSDIKKLDAGKWKGEQFTGERIPLLQDVFDLLGGNVYYDIEIKCRKTSETGIERALSKLIREYSLESRCIVSSFNPMTLKYFKKQEPEIKTAIIYCSDGELPWYLRHGEGRWIGTTDILKPIHTKINSFSMFINRTIGHYPVLPWTVDTAEEARRLLQHGTDGIISNDPLKAAEAFRAVRK